MMNATEVAAARARLRILADLVHLDPDRPFPEPLRAERRKLQEALSQELARRLAELLAQEPPPNDLKQIRKLSAGSLTQAAAGQVLRKLMQHWEKPDGRTPSQLGFRMIESDAGSALDWTGADFVIVAPPGSFIPLDVTCNRGKSSAVAQIPMLRRQGMLDLADFPKWVDRYGLSDALFQLEQELKPRFARLIGWAEGSPLHLLDVRLPAGLAMSIDIWGQLRSHPPEADLLRLFYEVTQARQGLETFVVDLETLAQGSPEPAETLVREYADHFRWVRMPWDKAGPLHALDEQLEELNKQIQAARRPGRPSFRPKREPKRNPPKRRRY
jgi:hypothetical protein